MHNELTRKDIEDMEKEIEYRRLVVRPQVLEDVKQARAQGDLSENFEYYAAKRAKNKNDSRIRFLERMIRTAKVVEDRAAADEAGVNKKITVYIPEDDAEETYTIVSTMRQDSVNALISMESPMGRALAGHRAGETVTVHVNAAVSYDVVIRAVEPADGADEAKLREF